MHCTEEETGKKHSCFLVQLEPTVLTHACYIVVFSSEHREPTEGRPSWGPRILPDGRRRALPSGQSHSPALRRQHPRSLARSGTSVGSDLWHECLSRPLWYSFFKQVAPNIKWKRSCLPMMRFVWTCLCFQPKLSMAKCRRNVENFLDACRKIGVPEVRCFLR